jgi:hypothetical protein
MELGPVVLLAGGKGKHLAHLFVTVKTADARVNYTV